MPAPRRVAAVVTAVGVLLIAGCTGGSDGPRPTTTPSPTVDAPAPTPSQAAPARPTSAPGTPTPTVAPTPTTPAGGLTAVVPFITYAGAGSNPNTIEVGAFVPEVIEDGGTCTASIPGSSVQVSAPASADATSTSCGLLVLPVAPAGQTVVVSYASATSAGTSDPVVAR